MTFLECRKFMLFAFLIASASAAHAWTHGIAVTQTQLPLQGNLAAHFDAGTTGFSNGQTVTSWTDTINSIVAGTTIGTGPTLTTNRLNGKPSVKCGGAGGLSIATPGALKTAIDSQEYTVFIVFRTLGSASNGALFSATAGGTSFFYSADGTNLTWQVSSTDTIADPGQTSFSTMGSASSITTPYTSGGFLQTFYINGGAVSDNVATQGSGTGGNTIAICDNAGNNFPVNAEIFDIVVWNVLLTPPQYMQAEKWACDKYAQSYPWAGLTSFNVFFGDSITQGVGASNIAHQAPYLAAQTKGLSFGQWHNLGVGGITVANMGVLAPTWVDPIPALLGFKTNLIGFEWFNENNTNPTLPLPFNHSQTYIAARHAIPNQRIVWGTSTSFSGDPSTNRNSYDTAFDGTIPNSNIDSYMSLHTDSNIGTSAAFANFPANWSDGVHLSDTGYPFLAADFVSGINALP